mgnify:CR=1 FL=1
MEILNNFAVPARTIGKKGNSLVKFIGEGNPDCRCQGKYLKSLHLDTLNQIKGFSPNASLQEMSSDFLLKFEIYMRRGM